jgi:tripeptide aminopeptidase
VTDYAHIRGESRSHDPRVMRLITKAYRDAFIKARDKVKDSKGRVGKVDFYSRLDYHPFRLREGSAVVKHALSAARSVGFEPSTRVGNGGLDANWLVRKGLPTVTFGAGQHNIHTTDEYVDLPEFYQGCMMALALATHAE